MFKTKFWKTYKNNSYHNYTFKEIPLKRFILVANGELRYISNSDKVNEGSEDAFFAMKDAHKELMGGDSPEMMRYKDLCYKYTMALCKAVKIGSNKGAHHKRVNDLYKAKEKLEKELFGDIEAFDYDDLVAKATVAVKFHIDQDKMTAYEFFKIIKTLQKDGNEGETN